jgi:hypothetical protein
MMKKGKSRVVSMLIDLPAQVLGLRSHPVKQLSPIPSSPTSADDHRTPVAWHDHPATPPRKWSTAR